MAVQPSTVFGHLIGAGYLALVVLGLTEAAPALASEVTGGLVGAAALSLGLTSGAMVWARVPHPPAGATTLIVSLGILREPEQLAVLLRFIDDLLATTTDHDEDCACLLRAADLRVMLQRQIRLEARRHRRR